MLRRVKRRRRLSMTALIDVIFLLLLFFMLSSTFSRFSEIDFAVGGMSGATQSADSLGFLRLLDTGLYLNGAALPLEELLLRLNRLEIDVLAVTMGNTVTAQRLTDLLVVLQAAKEIDLVFLEGAQLGAPDQANANQPLLSLTLCFCCWFFFLLLEL